MGGAVSTGQDNDDLIDNLLEADYIRAPLVEKVFRAVDRAEYFLPDSRTNAYKDLAWKSGNLHLSAPCIYSEVMEGLSLRPGLSFLNLGSGTGYLSTMVGLILGANGINHGVEIHSDVILYATKKLEDFKKYSGAIDEYDFCEPKFIQGNCLCLSSDTRQYDRVYCGAACPEPHENYMKNLLKVGGILVMPLNEQLLQVKRTSETSWDARTVLPVSFATLIQPQDGRQTLLTMMDVEPLSLQALCRAAVRNILRKNVDYEYPNLKSVPTTKKVPKKKRALRRLVVPLFDSSDESTDDDNYFRNSRNRDLGRLNMDNSDYNENGPNRDVSTLIDFVLGRLRDRRNNAASAHNTEREGQESNNVSDGEKTESANSDVQAVIENEDNGGRSHQHNEDLENLVEPEEEEDEKTSNPMLGGEIDKSEKAEEDMDVDITSTNTVNPSNPSREVEAIVEHPQEEPPQEESYGPYLGVGIINGIQEVIVGVLNELRHERGHGDGNEDVEEHSEEEPVEVDVQKPSGSVDKPEEPKQNRVRHRHEKIDSGLGDEIFEKDTASPDTSDLDNVMEIDSSSSSDENQEDRPSKRGSRPHTEVRTGGKWRRITLSNHRFDNASTSENENASDETIPPVSNEIRTLASPYTALMKGKIQELPLPPVLKNYLNFYREF